MASLQQFPSGNFHITLQLGGKRYKRSLKTKNRRTALALKARAEETTKLVEQGRIQLPESVDIPTFLLSDGKLANKLISNESRLANLFDQYFDSLPPGGLEPGTVKMMEIHRRHLERGLGRRFSLKLLKFNDLQSYVNQRASKKGIRGRNLHPSTIKKEINTLRAVWKWAVVAGEIPDMQYPSTGLRYPRSHELPPFQTFDEIVRQTKNLDPDSADAQELWATVFLNRDEIEDLLDSVRENARHDFIYPLFVFAAHTGARRSEIMRSQSIDFGDLITIRERKRKKRQASTRQVPISARLRQAMDAWSAIKPASQFTICHAYGSSCHSQPGEPLTASECNKHFGNSLKNTKFKHLRGWHVFRHSFCSNCAARGIDQRVIDEWVGHTTEEMRRRYRHLFPNTQQQALESVFS